MLALGQEGCRIPPGGDATVFEDVSFSGWRRPKGKVTKLASVAISKVSRYLWVIVDGTRYTLGLGVFPNMGQILNGVPWTHSEKGEGYLPFVVDMASINATSEFYALW